MCACACVRARARVPAPLTRPPRSRQAELKLLHKVSADADAGGCVEVRLSPALQVGGAGAFYARAGFVAAEGAPAEPTDDIARVRDKGRVLFRKREGAGPPAAASAAGEAAAAVAPPPGGYEWGGTF